MSDFRTRVHFVNVPAETLRLVKKISQILIGYGPNAMFILTAWHTKTLLDGPVSQFGRCELSTRRRVTA